MGFQAKKAIRKRIYTKIALMAPSGGGKTYSSLRLATGMAREIEKETGEEARILFGNTEGERGYYYANEFNYDIVDLVPPHNPEMYVDFIDYAVKSGYKILILDSSSHEWEGKGGCLDLHKQAGGTYQCWGKITPRHDKFIAAIADSPIHIIATMRGKDQYETNKDEKGKMTVQKLGVGAKQRDGFEYEFTCTFLIDVKTNCADSQKDNTHIFEHEGSVLLSETHGEKIIKWANSGEGYNMIAKKYEVTESQNEDIDELKQIKNNIIAKCKELGGSKNEILMNKIKEFVASGNPNAIKTIEKAKECLEAISNLKDCEVTNE